MLPPFQTVIAILLVFTALGLLCAVLIGRRRPAPADPFSRPFGEMPGFTREQLEAISRRPVEAHHHRYCRRAGGELPSPVAGSGRLPISSADSAARTPGFALRATPGAARLEPDLSGVARRAKTDAR